MVEARIEAQTASDANGCGLATTMQWSAGNSVILSGPVKGTIALASTVSGTRSAMPCVASVRSLPRPMA